MTSIRPVLDKYREWLTFDCKPLRAMLSLGGALAGAILLWLRFDQSALRLLTKAHRSNGSSIAARLVERFLRARGRRRVQLVRSYREYLTTARATPELVRFLENPQRLLGARMLVLKSPRKNEKGVLLIDYSFAFRIFGTRFDVSRIAAQYHIVLEPSWSGFCDLDILSFTQFPFRVLVESSEPRDTSFLLSLRSNLVPVPVSANWWVDHRVMCPIPGVAKQVDFIYIAAWARYKRHARLFEALSALRRRGERFTLLLIGYPGDLTKDDVFRTARDFGLQSNVELREGLTPEDVNLALNTAKVNLLWSRREGVNRAVIEGLLAGIPCVIRQGFNFGYRYPFVNSRTGCFVTEQDLPRKLLWMRDNYQVFAPRTWVLEHMSCQQAAAVITSKLHEIAMQAGETWTTELVVKVNYLNRMSYWNPVDEGRFADDYSFLSGSILAIS